MSAKSNRLKQRLRIAEAQIARLKRRLKNTIPTDLVMSFSAKLDDKTFIDLPNCIVTKVDQRSVELRAVPNFSVK